MPEALDHVTEICADRTNISLAILPMSEQEGYDDSVAGAVLVLLG